MRRMLTFLPLAALLAAPPARAQSLSTPTPATPPTAAAPAVAQPAQSSPSPVTTKWSASFYGFAEADGIYDTKQGVGEVPGNPSLARDNTYGGNHGQLQETIRNSRIGFRLGAPEYHGMKASGIVEMDFLGTQPNQNGGNSEGGLFNSPDLRVRHVYLKLETPYVDLLAGQSWQLFGWQPYFHPSALEIQGVPGQVYARTAQFRLSRTFRSRAVNLDLAVAAARPPQRDAATPDGQAGARISFNQWKGMHTAGSTGTGVDALSFGASGVWRKFELANAGTTDPTKSTTTHGWGYSLDGFIPVIPATLDDRANALSLTGSFVKGAGIQDMYSGFSNGIAGINVLQANGVDPGLVKFDPSGKLVAVKVQSYILGAQYYTPIDGGAVWLSGAYSDTKSDNAPTLAGAAAAWKEQKWTEAALFWDATKAVRFGASWSWFEDTYGDGQKVHNDRYQVSAFYLF